MNRCTTQDEQLLFLLSQLSPFAIVSCCHSSFCNSTPLQLYSYYFVDMYTQMKRCSAHKIDNCSWLFHVSPFAILDCAFILKLAFLCGILIILSGVSSYLPLHIFIELHSYTLRYVHLGEWACPVREWACPVQEKQLILCLLTLLVCIQWKSNTFIDEYNDEL